MGTLSDFDLGRIIADFGSRFLVETGTGKGTDVSFAGTFPFEHVYSIEKSHGLAIQVAFRNASNQRMSIIHDHAERGLEIALGEIPAEAPVIFWMNTHPSFGGDARSSPLDRELRLIAGLRDVSKDVFLIDDLRLYEDGPYGDGSCPAEQMAPPQLRDLHFVDDILGPTHGITRLFQRTGYLCAFPNR